MKRELKIFTAALIFYSHIPVSLKDENSKEYFSHSIRYFPLVGIIVSTLSAAAFYCTYIFISKELALITALIMNAVLTGALHEDGFADSCDGLGGGWNKSQILTIMKDSRVGTYGVLGLIFLFATKFYLLKSLPVEIIPISLIAGGSVSRGITSILAFTLPYATEINTKSSSVINFNSLDLVLAILFGLLPLILYLEPQILFALLIPLLTLLLWRSFLKRKINGYTGDTLGALQQLTEVGFYISVLLLWKYM